jgi:hypothetical protein
MDRLYVVKVDETVPGFSEETRLSEWPRAAAPGEILYLSADLRLYATVGTVPY